MKTTKGTLDRYAEMGLAALLPGMRYMLELMQKAVDEQGSLLTALQESAMPMTLPAVNRIAAGKSGWPDDPAARSVEMRRRQALAAERRGEPSLSLKRKADWAALSPKERKARLAAMKAGKTKSARGQKKAGRAAAAAPLVTMEKTA